MQCHFEWLKTCGSRDSVVSRIFFSKKGSCSIDFSTGVEVTVRCLFVFCTFKNLSNLYSKHKTATAHCHCPLPLPTELCISYFKLRISPIPNNKSVITIAYCDSPLRQPTANCPPPTATANCKKLLDCARSDRALYFVFWTSHFVLSTVFALCSILFYLTSQSWIINQQ